MAYVQSRLICDRNGGTREVSWELDIETLNKTQKWTKDKNRLQNEIESMAKMFPSFSLTLSIDGKIPTRDGCNDFAAPTSGAWRWISDGKPIETNSPPTLLKKILDCINLRSRSDQISLTWSGLLPAPLGGLPKASKLLQNKFPIENIRGVKWTVVPIRIFYPSDFPKSEPKAFYELSWLEALKCMQNSSLHLYSGGQMCLFYPGQWKRGYSAADVLSQRVVNHVYSILKISDGTSSHEAFIGRIHSQKWVPEA